MYESHPVRNNICGSVASIATITAEQLYECHRLFYNLSNMALVVCGNVTPEQVMSVVDRTLPTQATPLAFERISPSEPPRVIQSLVEGRMPVSKPLFCIGIKDPFVPNDAMARLRRDTALTLLDEILFSRAGEFYNTLFEENIVTPTFSAGYSCCESFGFHAISGESDTPELILERLKTYLKKIRREGIDDQAFARCRRVLYADELRAYDSTEEIANRLTAFVFEGTDMLCFPSVLQDVTKQELEALLDKAFADAYFTLSVIRPLS
jgi:predicted Zn-dependent peptidase